MNTMRGFVRFGVVRLYVWLLGLYPGRFRAAFRDEIEDVFLNVMDEAEIAGGYGLFKTSMLELRSLAISVIVERWHEFRSRKDGVMSPQEKLMEAVVLEGISLKSGIPDKYWMPLWVIFTTIAFPIALLLTAPFAVLAYLTLNLGVNIGLWSDYDNTLLDVIGFCVGFSLTLAIIQWFLLRNYLPRARQWFLATGAGVLIGGISGGIVNMSISDAWKHPGLRGAIILLPIGCFLGVAHWLVLRRSLSNSHWIVPIDILGTCSLLLVGITLNNRLQALLYLIVFILPGLITGGGLWYLFNQAQPEVEDAADEKKLEQAASLLTRGQKRVMLIALVPIFFLCSWIYAGSQLMLAKHEGIYPSAREGMIEKNSQGWGGAEVVSVEVVSARVNQHDGGQPHVWYVIADITLDRVPEGWDRSAYSGGSYFVHVKDGWVHLAEGTFPDFIGWVMQLYNMEGVNDWIAENQ
ncbi:MAG: hypothetical protein JXB38_07685 [Anaerolineales bacterium]|nr:hypothetical protein [Anaerolineales bacterium]